MDELVVFTGNAHRKLAEDISFHLGIQLGKALVDRFSEGEIKVKIDENVRGKDVFLIQSTSPPPNENLMELLIILDALKRASAKRITAVIPYYGYARQDRKDQPRVPITAKLVANLISCAGADRVLTVDLHAGQIQGFFDIPLDHLLAVNVFVDYFKRLNLSDLTIVAPDVGGIKMARAYAKRMSAGLAIVDKRRVTPEEVESVHILGEVREKNLVIIDDLIATGGTLIEAVDVLKENGAKNIYAAITHGILSGDALKKIDLCKDLKELIITDTIPSDDSKKHPRIKVLSVAPLLAEAIKRIHNEESVSSLFE